MVQGCADQQSTHSMLVSMLIVCTPVLWACQAVKITSWYCEVFQQVALYCGRISPVMARTKGQTLWL